MDIEVIKKYVKNPELYKRAYRSYKKAKRSNMDQAKNRFFHKTDKIDLALALSLSKQNKKRPYPSSEGEGSGAGTGGGYKHLKYNPIDDSETDAAYQRSLQDAIKASLGQKKIPVAHGIDDVVRMRRALDASRVARIEQLLVQNKELQRTIATSSPSIRDAVVASLRTELQQNRTELQLLQNGFSRSNVQYTLDPTSCRVDVRAWVADGSYGSVFETCVENNCNYVIKFVPLDVPIPSKTCNLASTNRDNCFTQTRREFATEVEYNTRLNGLGIGPRLFRHGICERVKNQYQADISVGYMVFDKWDTTLDAYVRTMFGGDIRTVELGLEPLQRKLDVLFRHNIYLPDLHTGNILLKLDAYGRIKDATPSDFGAVIEGTEKYAITRTTVRDVLSNRPSLK